MEKDFSAQAIVQAWNEPEYSPAEAFSIAELPAETFKQWYRRGELDGLQMESPGQGKARKFSLWQVLALGYMRRLTFLSLPVGAAREAALAFHPYALDYEESTGRAFFQPGIRAAITAAEHPVDCEGKVFGLIYHHIDGEWVHRVAKAATLDELGGLVSWIDCFTKDSGAVVFDLGRLVRVDLVRCILAIQDRTGVRFSGFEGE